MHEVLFFPVSKGKQRDDDGLEDSTWDGQSYHPFYRFAWSCEYCSSSVSSVATVDFFLSFWWDSGLIYFLCSVAPTVDQKKAGMDLKGCRAVSFKLLFLMPLLEQIYAGQKFVLPPDSSLSAVRD